VLVAGFGAMGVADNPLDALRERGREPAIVANNSGNDDDGLAC
jgi:3-oxoadipate CoA-transferase alpha subunit